LGEWSWFCGELEIGGHVKVGGVDEGEDGLAIIKLGEGEGALRVAIEGNAG